MGKFTSPTTGGKCTNAPSAYAPVSRPTFLLYHTRILLTRPRFTWHTNWRRRKAATKHKRKVWKHCRKKLSTT